MNTKEKGNIALSSAIRHYVMLGFSVSIPISESTKYDLIVDKDNRLLKVQCKYTSYKQKSSNFVAPLRVMGGNQTYSVPKNYSKEDFDILFVETSNGDTYEIPSEIALINKNSITLGIKYVQYKLG